MGTTFSALIQFLQKHISSHGDFGALSHKKSIYSIKFVLRVPFWQCIILIHRH